jgi:hypothetical protein
MRASFVDPVRRLNGPSQAIFESNTQVDRLTLDFLDKSAASTLVTPERTDPDSKKICTACGYLVWTKAKISTEAFRRPHPGDAALTRWGEAAQSERRAIG